MDLSVLRSVLVPVAAAFVGAVVGGAAAIVGGIIGGWMQGRAWYHYEQKRAVVENRARWERIALEWYPKGRKDCLRRADLQGAYLPGVNLARADLMAANLQGADLRGSNLQGTRLIEANLRDTNLQDADLRGSHLTGADLRGANLTDTLYDIDTIWPNGFAPPPEAKLTERPEKFGFA